MVKFDFPLTDEQVSFVTDNYEPYVRSPRLHALLGQTIEFFTVNVAQEHWQNPAVMALAGTYLFTLMNVEMGMDTAVPNGLLDMIYIFRPKGC